MSERGTKRGGRGEDEERGMESNAFVGEKG